MPRAIRPPCGSDCPDRASPSRGRSNTSSPGCRRRRSASPEGGKHEVARARLGRRSYQSYPCPMACHCRELRPKLWRSHPPVGMNCGLEGRFHPVRTMCVDAVTAIVTSCQPQLRGGERVVDDHDGNSKTPTTRRSLHALEYPGLGDFDDPTQEWRRLFSELFGTFLLVLVGAGGAVVNASSGGAISRSTAVAAPGLMVMAIILFMGAVSGAHLNPAVTLGFTLRGDFPWRRVPGYIFVQLLGATLACLFLWAVLGKLGRLGATEPGAGISDWKAMLFELILTVGLLSTILGTASRAQNVGALSAVAVGGYIILAGFWSSPISGASMNPARSFGPDLALADFSHYWVYVVGPLCGALVAVAFAWVLRGPGGDAGGLAAARGEFDTRVELAKSQTSTTAE